VLGDVLVAGDMSGLQLYLARKLFVASAANCERLGTHLKIEAGL